MVSGGLQAVDTFHVTHATDGKIDGMSTATFKTFEMRREKLQSETVDLVWIDERPDEAVYSELYARTSACDGHLMVSYTPIGDGAAVGVTYKFLSEPSTDRAAFRITSEETKHITATREEELAAGYSDAERETRLEGIPQLGSGPIFPIELLPALIKSFDSIALPFWARWCVGVDFGFRGRVCSRDDCLGARHRRAMGDQLFYDETIVRALSRCANPQHDRWAAHPDRLAA